MAALKSGAKTTRYYASEPGKAWEVVKKEAKHYWHGSKLLVADVKTAFRIMWTVFQGKELTRRERRQLVRTAADVARLVPMSVFVLIPFMELLLPVALKIFPNMLPSTFEEQHKREENLKRELVARLELAEFLQDTMESMARNKIKQKERDMDDDEEEADTATELSNVMTKVRTGNRVTTDEILALAKIFDDEITLDNIARPQLVSMCKYMGLHSFGSDTMLRLQLKLKLQSLKDDDKQIEREGIETLSRSELITALRDRGMRATGLTEAGYRRNLQQWLELSLHHQVPASLLIMSRAFNITERRQPLPEESLKDTIASIESELLTEALVEAGVASDEQKLELLRQQNELIEKENKEAEEKAAAKKAKEEAKRLEKEEAAKQAKEEEEEMARRAKELGKKVDVEEGEIMPDTTVEALQGEEETQPVATEEQDEETKAAAIEEKKKEKRVSLDLDDEEDPIAAVLQDVTEDLSVMASESAVDEEREMLAKLKAKQEKTAAEVEADALELEKQRKKKLKEKQEEKEPDEELVDRLVEEERLARDLTAKQQRELDQVEQAMQEDDAKEAKAAAAEKKREEEKALQKQAEEEAAARLAELQEAAAKRDADLEDTLKTRDALKDKVESMLKKIEQQIEDVDQEIGDKLRTLDLDKDGRITYRELEDAIRKHLDVKVPEDQVNDLVRRFRDLAEADVPEFLRGLRKSVTVEDVKKLAKEYKLRYEEERKQKKLRDAAIQQQRQELEVAAQEMADRAQRAADALTALTDRLAQENRERYGTGSSAPDNKGQGKRDEEKK